MTTAPAVLSLLVFMGFMVCNGVSAKTIRVSSLAKLQSAIDNAEPGDIIILTNGVYNSTNDIVINIQGKPGTPITITTEYTGGAEITGDGGFSIIAPATYIIIKGFKFTHAAAHANSSEGTSFCRWTRNVFETPGKGDYLSVNGNDHQIDYNTFQHKNSLGKFIAVRGVGSQIAQRLWIHHNYFFSFQNQANANGAEALQFGLSGFSLSSSNSIVEHNLFENCHGENELISVKASEVTLRHNTIRNCPAQFTLRHGNRSLVYGNFFINTPGIRIFGDDHVVHSNYFENCSMAINIGNGGGEVAEGDKLTSHDRPDRVLVAFNTLVNNQRNIVQTQRKNGLGATSITIAYNIIQGGGLAAEIAGPLKDAVWKGNIVLDTQDDATIPAEGSEHSDPRLFRNDSGTFHLNNNSPAVNYCTEIFTAVTMDLDGQPRNPPLDAGADEISDSRIIARLLTKQEVGHTAAEE